MTFDQKIQLWMLVGTWVAGLATLLAVMTAFYLATNVKKVRLRIFVGIRFVVMRGDGSPREDRVCFDVTNVGERPVIITKVGWVVGKRKKRRYGIQPLSDSWKQCPAELTHAENAEFMISSDMPKWVRYFSEGFINDPSGQSLKTLRAQVFTSVGQTFEIKPESGLIDRLRGIAERTTRRDG